MGVLELFPPGENCLRPEETAAIHQTVLNSLRNVDFLHRHVTTAIDGAQESNGKIDIIGVRLENLPILMSRENMPVHQWMKGEIERVRKGGL